MRVFPHGNIVIFEASVREMTGPGLDRLLKNVISDHAPVVAGLLDMDQQAVFVFGQAKQIRVDEQEDRVEVITQSEDGEENAISRTISDLVISHEVYFDIEDASTVVRYPVFYVTFNKEGEASGEETLFLAPRDKVSQPLECVVEFWNQSGEVGRDVDFPAEGCRVVPDFKNVLQTEKEK